MELEDAIEVELKCNDIQRAIIEEIPVKNGLINVVSGPGTGKTKTLCDRIAYLLSRGTKYDEILVFSLTNQAVEDFKKTLSTVIGDELASLIQVSTIHSFANSILLSNSSYWQIVMDKSVHFSTINEIMRLSSLRNKMEYKDHFEIKDYKKLPKLKNDDLLKLRSSNPDLYRKYLGFEYIGELTELKSDNLVYDKIVYEATQTLSLYHKIGDLPESKINVPFPVLDAKEIIVDEFQDISYILLDFILELVRDKQLTIAGDIDQSLYEFNGATPDYNINKIIPYYQQPGYKLKEFVLDETFRFGKDIHKMSVNLLGQSKTLIRKTVDEPSLEIVREEFYSLLDEYEFIFNEIKRLIEKSDKRLSPKNFAVLSRTNQSLIDLQSYFANKNSNYRVKRLTNLLPWMETKLSSILSFIKILENPQNDACLIALIGMLNKVGPITVLNIKKAAERESVSVCDYLRDKGFPKSSKVPQNFISQMENIIAKVDKSDPSSILHQLMELCKLFDFPGKLEKSNVSLSLFQKLLEKLMAHLKVLQSIYGKQCNLVSLFLNSHQTEFLKDTDELDFKFEHPDESITFSTIHSAKGLQWDIVFVVSTLAVTGSSTYSTDARTNYVAATRAKHLLYYNKSAHDSDLYIDTLDERKAFQNSIQTKYEKTVLDYIPELKRFAVPNNLRELPRFSKPYGKLANSDHISMLVNNIKNRSLRGWSNYGAGINGGIRRLCKKI